MTQMKQYIVWSKLPDGTWVPIDFDTFDEAVAYWANKKLDAQPILTEFIPLAYADGRKRNEQ